ncbi:MAG: hypothetical protein Q8P67_10095, partial [archaeon]|nr:hypothetical protein [archaeon]
MSRRGAGRGPKVVDDEDDEVEVPKGRAHAAAASSAGRGGNAGGFNAMQIRDKIIAMSKKRKITSANCWQLPLDDVIVPGKGDDFRLATPLLTAATDVYEKRVEATHA